MLFGRPILMKLETSCIQRFLHLVTTYTGGICFLHRERVCNQHTLLFHIASQSRACLCQAPEYISHIIIMDPLYRRRRHRLTLNLKNEEAKDCFHIKMERKNSSCPNPSSGLNEPLLKSTDG